MRSRLPLLAVSVALVAGAVPAVAKVHPGASTAAGYGPLAVARDAAPVTLTGAQVAAWAAPAAQGLAKPYPSGAAVTGDGVRDAHNGTLVVPPTPPGVTQVDPDTVAAYSWTGGAWKQIPVQVDERFPYFLANGRSSFSTYSGTDEELTYAWAGDGHSTGEEAWKKTAGDCTSTFPAGEASMRDPQPLFDTDDELSFQAGDAGAQAPTGTATPPGTSNGQVVSLADPLDPTTQRFVYLFTQPGGSSYSDRNGYVKMTRDDGSTDWIDRDSFSKGAPDGIGLSNTGYGPNLTGTVCHTAADNPDGVDPTLDGTPRPSKDRNPRDSFTVTTPTYRIHATGRWLVQGLQVRKPNGHGWSDNIVQRWKGRAFQQSPDSDVSLVGFEDEQVNWEMNSSLLGWRVGPVRGIREVWGADSGTNVTKTEYYYRDADVFAYHLRVHPIPPDGLYTDWAYRPGVATTYFNLAHPEGVAIDGVPDTSMNEIDQLPVTGQKAYVNTCDPKDQLCSALDNPEEVAGKGFGLVYSFELTGPTAAAGNAAVVPYYRDDACFDDGTGDAPVQRPWPGEASTDPRVKQGYVDYWAAHGMPVTGDLDKDYAQLKCQPQKAGDGVTPPWQVMPFTGAIGEHGLHFFATQDSDNAFGPKPVDEVDGQQWRYSVPMATPTNVLVPYGANVSAKLVPVVTPYAAG